MGVMDGNNLFFLFFGVTKNNNMQYITVTPAMQDLGIHGNDILTYAYLVAHCKENGKHKLRVSSLFEFLLCSRPIAVRSLNFLIDKGLIGVDSDGFHFIKK